MKSADKINLLNEKLGLFKHKIEGKVEFYEVDSFGVTHNVRYFYWFERARIEFMSALGLNIHPETFLRDFPLMVAHSESDFFRPLRFNDEYSIHTRVSALNKSSLEFENLVTDDDNKVVARGASVMVHLDAETGKPAMIPDDLKERFKNFAGATVNP